MCVKHVVQDADTEVFQSCSEGLVYLTRMDRSVVKYYPGQLKLQMIRVSEIIKPSGSSSGNTSNTARGPYTKLTPAQRLMIGKRTSEHGTTATVNHAPRYTTLHRTVLIAITWSSAQ